MTVQHASTHASLSECVGTHVRAAVQAEALEWQPPYGVVRVLAHTCERCQHVSYEFAQLGGAYVIRRTDRKKLLNPVVHQTAPVHHALAWSWWQALLYGRAV